MVDAVAGDAPAAPAKSKMLVIVLCSLLAAGAAGGGVYFMTAKKGGEEHAAPEAAPAVKTPAIYSKFDPPFVVNFQNKGQMRFLQVSIEVMTRDAATADLLKQHDPKLRNDLLMLLGGQTFETLSSREGKEQLRAEALKAVADVIVAEGGKPEAVEQLYFTSFVMQ
ncbi:MAG TPA: flagellar basal body-associated FliL family protein [Steroidobacter sp.]|uniref:flagellar basal body-associated FliL family protein n=1 Tax=Steroidobacter sp. TaxID=1978227 RepID=UPI002EDACEB9